MSLLRHPGRQRGAVVRRLCGAPRAAHSVEVAVSSEPPLRQCVTRKSSSRDSLRQAADRYLADSFAGGTPPHVNEFAHRIGISLSGLSRTFAAETGSTVGAYFKNARIGRAKELLGTTNLSLTEIAHAAGFGTRTTMFRSFRRAVGLTPDEYRSRARAIGAE